MSATRFVRSRDGHRSHPPGFALPLAILALTMMTAAIMAAYSSTTAEIVSNNAMRAQNRASLLAETGLQQFVQNRGGGSCTNCAADPAVADSEWTRISLVGGYADVVATRIRPRLADTIPALFFIRSTGVDTMARLSGQGLSVYARRTVGQYATYGTATIKPLAAWTSFNGITNTARVANAGTGADACATPAPTVAGYLVPGPSPPDRQYHYAAGLLNILGTNYLVRHPSGSPGVDSSLLLDTLKRRAGIDWNAIVNYDAIPADVTIPPSSFPSSAAFSDATYWPVIRSKSNLTLPNSGRGLLIVDGNLDINSGEGWDGIILVGGRLKLTGFGTIEGAVISGLNRTLPGASNPANGTSADNDSSLTAFFNLWNKAVNYSSCNANQAAGRLKMYFAWQNTWLDNVAIW